MTRFVYRKKLLGKDQQKYTELCMRESAWYSEGGVAPGDSTESSLSERKVRSLWTGVFWPTVDHGLPS